MEKNNPKEEKLLKKVLEERLQQVSPENGEAPAELKEEVFSTLDMISFLADLADFFTLKFTETEISILEALNEDSPEEEE